MGRDESVDCVAFSPTDPTLLAVGSSRLSGNTVVGEVNIWNVADRTTDTRVANAHCRFRSLAFSSNGRTLAGGDERGMIRHWNLEELPRSDRNGLVPLLGEIRGHMGAICCVKFSPSKTHLYSVSFDDTVRRWNVADFAEGNSIKVADQPGDDTIYTLSLSPDDRHMVTGGIGPNIRLWDISTRQLLGEITIDVPAINDAEISPLGNIVAYAGGKWPESSKYEIGLWDVLAKRKTRLQSGQGLAHTVAFSPNGRYVASGTTEELVVWEVASGKKRFRQSHPGLVRSVAWHPDGDLIATGSPDYGLRLWSFERGKHLALLSDINAMGLAFSPDGTKLASGDSMSRLQLRHASNDWREPRELAGHSGLIWNVQFSPDSRRLVSASHDGTARVWNVLTGNSVLTLRHGSAFVMDACFSHSGSLLLTGAGDLRHSTVHSWQAVEPTDVKAVAEGQTTKDAIDEKIH